ncbi:hypothetical protein [Burkholderia gladioli]|uniref:hypothetical protein n=1 Tax=Burkholderia gladioli TaxID=28095 RepID=UPI003C7E6B84
MKKSKLVALAAIAAATFGLAVGPAHAEGCLKGAVVGAAVGHVAGHHAVLGAIAGCAINHHMAKVKRQRAADAAAYRQNARNEG